MNDVTGLMAGLLKKAQKTSEKVLKVLKQKYLIKGLLEKVKWKVYKIIIPFQKE